MLPLLLSVEGLYSYQERQVIDFTQLTEAGLFGIFGSVGSGKSSILEAISFALYGDTERLNKTDRRAYNMMNLKSNQTLIVFEFLNFEQRKFRFVAQWKRRKNFEDTTQIERTAYEWKEEQWIPMDSADGAKVTNLSYPNFRRTIIIPQGQFKEFLELKGKDRSEMMKEIFYLNKFDLGPKVSTLQFSNNRKLENLKGALSGFEMISAEALELKHKEVEETKASLAQTKGAYQDLLQQVQVLQEYHDKHVELQGKNLQYQELLLKVPKIKQQENELNKFEQTSLAFKEPLIALQELNVQKESLIHRIENLQINKENKSKEIDHLELEIQQVQDKYMNLPVFRAEAEDLKLIIQIKENNQKENDLEKRAQKGAPYVEAVKKAILEVENKIVDSDSQLDALKAEKMDTNQLIDMEKWYQRKETLLGQEQSVQEVLLQLDAFVNEQNQVFESEGYTIENWEDLISREHVQLEKEIKELRNQETHIQVQGKLSHFASSLESGKPCPLCGALDHPSPMVSQHVQEELKKNLTAKQRVEQQMAQIQNRKDRLTKVAMGIANKLEQKQKLESDLKAIQLSIANHFNDFVWNAYSPENTDAFEAQKQKVQANEKRIAELELNQKNWRLDVQRQEENLQKYERELELIRSEISGLKAVNLRNTQELKQFNLADYEVKVLEEVKKSKILLDQQIIDVEATYLTLTQKINTYKTQLAEVVGQYHAAKEQLSTYNAQLKSKQEHLAKLLREFKFNDITEVQLIIQRQLPVEQLRQEIQQFFIRLEVLESQIGSLETFLADKTFTVDQLENTKTLFQLKKEELELQFALFGGLEKELAHLTLEFGKKEKLLEEFDLVSNRASNLKVLENLFKGNGFVNYISSIHLNQMCEMANQRFHRLTRNKLSLALNENNEFEVIDYLNNGYRRSVKTLSGGQSFQASLCLALALAENIQSLNKSDKNFFFIDEGFGTQDAESINTVFDTLQYLHQENRVVGIISHVEELKERIPRSVTVVNDLESGSKITVN